MERAEKEAVFIELKTLVDEFERRQKEERLRFYNTGDKVHLKQLEFHKCQKRNRWAFGGNRTGKTEGGAVEAAWRARGNHPFHKITRPTRGWVVSLTNEVQRDVAQKKLLSYINPAWIKRVVMRTGRADDIENGIIDFITIESEHGGESVIGFKSCDQGRAKFQGTSQDWIWFDEEPPLEIYQECRMRVLDTRGYIWGTMTPLMGLTWVHDLIYMNEQNDPDVWSMTMEWNDNPFLSKEEIVQLEATLTDDEREARQYGRFVSLTGLVYSEFKKELHVIEPFDVPKEWYDNISIDPGLQNPLSAHWYAVDGDGTIYVVAEHYEANRNIDYHSEKIKEKCKELEWPANKDGSVDALIDSAALQKTLAAEKNVVELFAERGINVNPNVRKDKWTGIQRVKTLLKPVEHPDTNAWPKGKPRILIFSTCGNMIKEFMSYRWAEGKDEPQKLKDHAMDELRYYALSRPEPYIAPKPEPTIIQKDKQDRIRRQRKIGGRY